MQVIREFTRRADPERRIVMGIRRPGGSPMNAGRLESVFAEALAQPTPEARAEFLADACGDDAELLGRVEGLLKAHDDAGKSSNHRPSPSPRWTKRPSRSGRVPALALTSSWRKSARAASVWFSLPSRPSRCDARWPSKSSNQAWIRGKSSPASKRNGKHWR